MSVQCHLLNPLARDAVAGIQGPFQGLAFCDSFIFLRQILFLFLSDIKGFEIRLIVMSQRGATVALHSLWSPTVPRTMKDTQEVFSQYRRADRTFDILLYSSP